MEPRFQLTVVGTLMCEFESNELLHVVRDLKSPATLSEILFFAEQRDFEPGMDRLEREEHVLGMVEEYVQKGMLEVVR